MTTELVNERLEAFVLKLRESRPGVPIVLVENLLNPSTHAQNRALAGIYGKLKKNGMKELYFMRGTPQLAGHENGTVDGVHPTDLGFMRIAEYYYPVLKRILNTMPTQKGL